MARAILRRETSATGAEVLTDEARLALKGLLDETALEELDDPAMAAEVCRTLEGAIPAPDEKEQLAFTKDITRVLTSTWVELLRAATLKAPIVVLSDQLLPRSSRPSISEKWFFFRSQRKSSAEQLMADALQPLGVGQDEMGQILTDLRARLFQSSFLVALPFDQVIVGARDMQAVSMTEANYHQVLALAQRSAAIETQPDKIAAAVRESVPALTTKEAQLTVALLMKPVAAKQGSYAGMKAGI